MYDIIWYDHENKKIKIELSLRSTAENVRFIWVSLLWKQRYVMMKRGYWIIETKSVAVYHASVYTPRDTGSLPNATWPPRGPTPPPHSSTTAVCVLGEKKGRYVHDSYPNVFRDRPGYSYVANTVTDVDTRPPFPYINSNASLQYTQV